MRFTMYRTPISGKDRARLAAKTNFVIHLSFVLNFYYTYYKFEKF